MTGKSVGSDAAAASLADRLARCHASVVHDVMKAMRLPIRVLPRTLQGLDPAMRCAGPVFTILGTPDPTIDADRSLFEWSGLLSRVPAGRVAIVQPRDDVRALFGGLSAEALKIKGARGYIVDGGCRDVQAIVDEGFPVFARYATPIDIVAAWRPEAYETPIEIGGHRIAPDDHVLADRDGIILIPDTEIHAVLEAAERKLGTETQMTRAIRDGMDPQQAYLKYRVF